MRPTPLVALLVLALSLSLSAEANKGDTRGEMSWLVRGANKTVERKGYGKLRVLPRSTPQVVLGKMKPLKNAAIKAAKWQTAGGVVVDPGSKKVLLVRIRKEAKGGRSGWTWPKGRLDPGELPPTAAIRETFEESGVQAQPVAKIAQLRTHKALRHYYLMNKMASARTFTSKETLEVRWVSLKEARVMLQRGRDKAVLKAAATTMKALEAAAALP